MPAARRSIAASTPGAAGGGASLPDWRLLAIGGVLLVGVILIASSSCWAASPIRIVGVTQPNDGGTHVAVGIDCRALAEARRAAPDPYSSVPAASGPHWDPSGIANWGVYSTPQPETQVIHNLEHGGIVIWYDPTRSTDAEVDELASYVEGQVATGIGGRFKFILVPVGRQRGSRRRGGRHRLAPPPEARRVRHGRHPRLRRWELPASGAPEPNGGPGA